MPFYVTDAVFSKLVTMGVSLDSAAVLILGAAFKKNVDDTRHSPAVRIIELLSERGIKNIQVADPYVDSLEVRVRGEKVTLTCSRDAARLVKEADVCVMVTDHGLFDYEDIAANAKAMVDTRNAFRGLDPSNYSLLGDGTFFHN